MLQALNLESAQAPARSRASTAPSSDSPDPTFAGLMAQASTMPPSGRTADVPSRSSDDAAPSRTDPKASSSSVDRSDDARNAAAAPPRSEDSAKDAVARTDDDQSGANGAAKDSKPTVPESTGKTVATTEIAVTGTAAASITPPLPQSAKASAAPQTVAPMGAHAAQAAGEDAEESVDVARSPSAAKAIPQGIRQSVEEAAGSTKPALTELMYLPKADLQTPRLNPEAAKTADSQKPTILGQAANPGNSQAQASLGKDSSAEADPATGKAPAKVVILEEALPVAAKLDALTHQPTVQKGTAPTVDAVQVPNVATLKTGGAVPAAEATGATIRANPVFTQVEGSIRWILQNKVQGAELQLHPESLGKVTIQLRVEGQEVHARLWASESSSMAVLQDHKTYLESSLREQGLTLGSFDLHSGARGNGTPNAPQDQGMTAQVKMPSVQEAKQEMPIGRTLDSGEVRQIEVYA